AGLHGPDGIYKRATPEHPEEKQFAVGESKTTGEKDAKRPIGKGELTTTKGGLDQLSNDWIRANKSESGLTPEQWKEFSDALDAGKVKKFYAHTTPKGTKYYRVIDKSQTQVEIGEEIDVKDLWNTPEKK